MNYISNINRFLNLKIIPIAFHSQTPTMYVAKLFTKILRTQEKLKTS